MCKEKEKMIIEDRNTNISFMTLRNCLLTKIVACLVIFTFTTANTAYGYDRASTLRMLRPEEALSQIELVESFIKDDSHHQRIIDASFDTGGQDDGGKL